MLAEQLFSFQSYCKYLVTKSQKINKASESEMHIEFVFKWLPGAQV